MLMWIHGLSGDDRLVFVSSEVDRARSGQAPDGAAPYGADAAVEVECSHGSDGKS